MLLIKLRYNTQQKDGKKIWRVSREGYEDVTVDEVNILTHCTTVNELVRPESVTEQPFVRGSIAVNAIQSVFYTRMEPNEDNVMEPLSILDIY
jgi:hypothetical protein